MNYLKEKLESAMRHLILANDANDRELAGIDLATAWVHSKAHPKKIKNRLERALGLAQKAVPAGLAGDERAELRSLLWSLHSHLVEVERGAATLGDITED